MVALFKYETSSKEWFHSELRILSKTLYSFVNCSHVFKTFPFPSEFLLCEQYSSQYHRWQDWCAFHVFQIKIGPPIHHVLSQIFIFQVIGQGKDMMIFLSPCLSTFFIASLVKISLELCMLYLPISSQLKFSSHKKSHQFYFNNCF